MWTTKRPNLLIIGGGSLQHQTLIECSNLDLGKILVDGNTNCFCANSPYLNPDYFIHADVRNPKLVLSEVKKWLGRNRKVS